MRNRYPPPRTELQLRNKKIVQQYIEGTPREQLEVEYNLTKKESRAILAYQRRKDNNFEPFKKQVIYHNVIPVLLYKERDTQLLKLYPEVIL